MRRTLDLRIDVIRNGVKVTELNPYDAPRIKTDYDSEIKSSFRGTFFNNDTVDWLKDKLEPIVIINGTEYPYGIFNPTTVQKKRSDSGIVFDVQAYDSCWILKNYKTEGILHFNAGVNYLDAIVSLLAEAGIVLITKTPNATTFAHDREDWDIGTDYLTIINQLLDEINYNDIWFNVNGIAVLEPDSVLDVSQSVRTYNYDSISSMMLIDSSSESELYDAPNVFLCICSNLDGSAPLVSKVENTNVISPKSIQKRGMKIMQLVKVNNIASQAELDEYANKLLLESLFNQQTVSFATAIMPDCGVNQAVTLIHPDAQGIFLENGWEINLETGGEMTHKLRKVAITNE